MQGRDYFTIIALPALGDLGSVPPIPGRALLNRIEGNGKAYTAVEAMLLSDDLLLRDAALAGEQAKTQPSVLTADQITGDSPLPDYLTAETSAVRTIAGDAVWDIYYHHAADIARQVGNQLLSAWVAYEVTLRNALASQRSRVLELEADQYLLAQDLACDDVGCQEVVSAWSAASGPLAATQVIDQARWTWLDENDRWFSFANEEIAAYAARLMILHRWDRTAGEKDQ